MGIHVSWHNSDQAILMVEYDAEWTLTDYYASVEKSYELMESVKHAVDIVQDASKMSSFPTRLISAAHYTEGRAHPRRRYMVIFGLHAFVRIILESSKRVAPNATKDMYFVNTKDEALSLLQKLTNPLSQT